MKVLLISPQNPYPPIDGGKISIFYPLMELNKKGISIGIFFLYKEKEPFEAIQFFKKNSIKVYPFLLDTTDSIKKVMKNFLESEPFKMAKYFHPSALKYLKKIVQEFKPDIIQSHHAHMAKYAIELKKEFNVPIVLREHNIEYKLIEQFYKSESNPIIKVTAYWQYVKTKKYETNIWSYFDKVIFISPLDENIAKNANSRIKSVVIQDGVDIEKFHPIDLKKEPYSLIFTGNLRTIQNLKSILWFVKNVWPIIKEKEPKAKLYITGGGEEILYKKLKISTLNTQGIFLLGFVKNIQETISKCQVFISPTRIGSGIRIKVLTAMALGMPIVCTSLDATPIIGVRNGEHLIVADTPEDFAEGILHLFNDERLRYNLGSNARKLIEQQFTWDKYAEKMINIYKEIIKGIK